MKASKSLGLSLLKLTGDYVICRLRTTDWFALDHITKIPAIPTDSMAKGIR